MLILSTLLNFNILIIVLGPSTRFVSVAGPGVDSPLGKHFPSGKVQGGAHKGEAKNPRGLYEIAWPGSFVATKI